MSVACAGWYIDPQDPSQLRYWDGASWSDLERRPPLGQERLRRHRGRPVPTRRLLRPAPQTQPT